MNHLSRALRFLTLDCVEKNSDTIGVPLSPDEWKASRDILRENVPCDDLVSQQLLNELPLTSQARRLLGDWIALTYDWVNAPYPWWRFYLLRLEKPGRLIPHSNLSLGASGSLQAFLEDCRRTMEAVKKVKDALVYPPSKWDDFLQSYYASRSEPELSWRPDLGIVQAAEMYHFQRTVCARRSTLTQPDLEQLSDLLALYMPPPVLLDTRPIPTLSQLPCPSYLCTAPRESTEFGDITGR